MPDQTPATDEQIEQIRREAGNIPGGAWEYDGHTVRALIARIYLERQRRERAEAAAADMADTLIAYGHASMIPDDYQTLRGEQQDGK